jgi:hypothetical protein
MPTHQRDRTTGTTGTTRQGAEAGGPFLHLVHIYEEDATLLDETSRLLGTALGAGGSAIALATAEHRDGIAARLADAGFDLDRLLRDERYIPLDAGELLNTLMPGGTIDGQRSPTWSVS